MTQKLADGVNQGIAKLQDKAAKVQHGLKLKGQLSDLHRQKGSRLMQMGAMVYRSMRARESVVTDALNEQAQSILELDKQIALLDRELALLHNDGGVTCPQCGQVSKGAQFCPGCGAKVADIGHQPTCSHCQSPTAPEATFCGHCGTRQ